MAETYTEPHSQGVKRVDAIEMRMTELREKLFGHVGRLRYRMQILERTLDQHERYLATCGGYPVGSEPERFTPDGMNAREIGYEPEEALPEDAESETKCIRPGCDRPRLRKGEKVFRLCGTHAIGALNSFTQDDEGFKEAIRQTIDAYNSEAKPEGTLARRIEAVSREWTEKMNEELEEPDADEESPAQDATAAMRNAVSRALGFRVREPDHHELTPFGNICWSWSITDDHAQVYELTEGYRLHRDRSKIYALIGGSNKVQIPPPWLTELRPSSPPIPHHSTTKRRRKVNRGPIHA